MESETSSRVGKASEAEAEEADDKEVVNQFYGTFEEAESSSRWLGKLLFTGGYEDGVGSDRFAFKDTPSSNHLEAVESAEEKAVGFAEIGHRQRLSPSDFILRRQILLCSAKNVCSKGYIENDTDPKRSNQSFGLLYTKTSFKI